MKKLLLTLGLLWFSIGSAQQILSYNLYLQDTNGLPVSGIYAILSDSSSVFSPITVGLVSDSMGMIQYGYSPNGPGSFSVQVSDFCVTYYLSYNYTPNTSVVNDTLIIPCPSSVPIGPNCNFLVNAMPVQSGGPNGVFFWNLYLGGGPGTAYTWDFGDGNTASTIGNSGSTTHYYSQAGTYNYCLTVDSCQVCDTVVVGGSTGSNGAIYVSGYVLGSALPSGAWANADVTVMVDNAIYTVTTDQNGFYSDSLPTTFQSGMAQASLFDCNGIITSGTLYAYDIAAGLVNVYDTLMVNCLPGTGTGNCQAGFIVDTVNSFNGQVVLWNTSIQSLLGQSTWLWDFGDGSFSNLQFPSHQYAQAGMYNVCLTLVSTDPATGVVCTSVYCDSLGMDANGNLIYKGQSTGFNLVVFDPSSVGQEENKLSSLNVYPNPASTQIRMEGFNGMAEYVLLDTYGRSLQKGKVSNGEMINLPELSTGIYLLDVVSEGKRGQVRLLID